MHIGDTFPNLVGVRIASTFGLLWIQTDCSISEFVLKRLKRKRFGPLSEQEPTP